MAALALDQVLRLAAREVEGLSVLASRTANALDAALHDATPTPNLLRDAQALDEMEQRLAGLRDYLDGVARMVRGGMVLDVAPALARLTLSAQADRLSGRDEPRTPEGALELF